MKKILLTFLLLIPLSIVAQRFDVKFKFDGEDREFIVVKPTGAVPLGGYPVVFMFHGSSGTGEQFYEISRWKERGEIEKFITVFPTALKYCVLNFEDNKPVVVTKWNNGNLQDDKCPNMTQNFKDDVKFIRKMVDTIKATFTVNPKKIFASGFSNGGGMAFKLAMDASDIFAAVGASGSALNALDSTKPSRRIPIINTIGTLDDRFTTPINLPEIPFGGDTAYAYFNKPINRVLACEGLSQTYTKNNTARTNTFIFNTPKTGETATQFVYSLFKDLYHQWPNGDNYPIVAADIYWEFFKQSVTTDVKEVRLPDNVLQVFPNPSRDVMTFNLMENTEGGTFNIAVFNLLGQYVYGFKNNENSQFIIKKEAIGKGLFIVKVNQGEKVMTKRIVFD